jgi:hypothetical protein
LSSPAAVFNSIPIPGGSSFGLQSGQCATGSDTLRHVWVLVPAGTKIVPGKDSLGLQPNTLSDRYGNLTPGNKASIDWGRAYPFTTETWPNPFQPGVSEIPRPLYDLLLAYSQAHPTLVPKPAQSSMVMHVQSIKRVDVENSSAKIYDALGNIVISNLPVYGSGSGASGDNFAFYVLWDGHNRSNRLVGSGTYLAVFTIKELGDSMVNTMKQKIGVKR